VSSQKKTVNAAARYGSKIRTLAAAARLRQAGTARVLNSHVYVPVSVPFPFPDRKQEFRVLFYNVGTENVSVPRT
jgi:hypothetical protein